MTITSQPATHSKKLIEVDLPLDAINAESSHEKSIRHGHPSTLHLWWARRPLASCRAVIFASMVDDPASCPDEFPTPEAVRAERRRLHEFISDLVKWENTDERNPEARKLLNKARYEIARSVARYRNEPLPRECHDNPAATLRYLADSAKPIYAPFAGGGSIPLEAQRLGLKAIASDLNPVAVLINKALIELPPQVRQPPARQPQSRPYGHAHRQIHRQRQEPQTRNHRMTRRRRTLRRHPLLRQLDAPTSVQTHRQPIPQSKRRRSDRYRMALGAHRPLQQPPLRRRNAP